MPRPNVTPEQMALLWSQDEVRVICARPPGLEYHPDLALRVRGAFGRALAQMGPPVAHRFDPFNRPRAFDLLFLDARSDEGGQIGRPMAIDAEVVGDSVIVDLRLFGGAGFWIDQAREALVAALASGITLRLGGRAHVGFEVRDCLYRRSVLEPALPHAREAVLAFRTPVRVRVGARSKSDPASILWSAVTRARGLASWQEVNLISDEVALRGELERLRFNDADLTEMHFERHSLRQGDNPIPVSGALGRMVVSGALRHFIPFLAIGEKAHIGSHAALGFGRYELALYP